ncbi:unnamed protein product [Oreochromis niloticus]|nr:unnamed protein product [Mustela putorius furo]
MDAEHKESTGWNFCNRGERFYWSGKSIKGRGQDLISVKNPSYIGRSSLFTDELKHGNISLKLSKVKPADEGRYRCYIPAKDEEAFIDLVVASGAVSSPVISLEGIDRDKTGVMLECKSEETLRGPDDLYTVSSRVTVEKRHSNNITCRVQQRNTNQSRETHIHVPDDFFPLVCSPAVPIIVCLTVCTILIVASGLFMFKWRQPVTTTRRNQLDEMEKGEKYSYSQRDINQEENEHEKLMAHEPVPPELLSAKHVEDEAGEDIENKAEMNETEEKQFRYSFKNLQNTRHGREDPVREVTTLKEKAENQKQADKKLSEELRETQKQLDNKTEENKQIKRHVDSLMASINSLKDEKQLQKLLETREKELEKCKEATKGLKEEVEKKKSEISELKTELSKQLSIEERKEAQTESQLNEVLIKNKELTRRLKEEIEKREQVKKEMEKLKNELKTKLKVDH